MRLTGGRLDEQPPLRRLVRPEIPIPADSTRIHGFDDAAVADAPRLCGRLAGVRRASFGDTVLIGHSIGFDLAVLERECARAEDRLAQPAEPVHAAPVARSSIRSLPISRSIMSRAGSASSAPGRHSALGDALIAAQIFEKLVPLLRDRGIRTLGEAIRACAQRCGN